MPLLPLFPLGTVLLPGSPLPLQIFEPRYLALLADLSELEPAQRVFGVVAIRRGREVGVGRADELYEIGCTARLQAAEVARTPTGGRAYRVATVGTDRFHLDELVDAGRPYLTAQVTVLDDVEEESPAEQHRTAERLVAAFVRYRRAVGAPETQVTGPLPVVATQVIDAMPVGLLDRQEVLEAAGVGARLHAALRIVQRESEILARFRAVPVPRGEVNPN